jgi:hypothetical protein
MEEIGFRIKMAQGGNRNSSVKLIKGSNVIVSEQITEQINKINHQLIKKKIDLSSALNILRECVGTKYGKYREERKEKKHKLLQANRSKITLFKTTDKDEESEC